ncbi:hypothetical protein V6N13_133017 [Hibiscus sabdariffa]
MADAVISAAVGVALSKAISILEDPINLAWDFKDQLIKLRSSFALTRAFLQDAERRQLDEPVKVWLEQLSDIASKADDVLDELAYQHLRRKVGTRRRTQVSNFFSPSTNPFAFTLKMAKKVKSITQSIKDLNSQATELGLQQRVQVSAPVSSGVGGGTHSLVNSSGVVGREADVLKVVDLLINPNTHQSLSLNEDAILREIQKELKDKSFLLVLDDVWDEDIKNWGDLKGSLQGINESKQSWILATSRSESVALVRETPPDHRYPIKAMIDEECWSIIKERAFGKSPLSPDLEAIGRDIAHRCGGVPLVATVIGGTMCNKWDKDEWLSLRDSSLWGSLEKSEGIDVEKDLYGCITSCKMHDLVRDLAQSISHIRQQQNVFDDVKLWHSLFFNSVSSFHMARDFKSLRVLKFSGANIESLPDSIGKLKHLKYFDISGSFLCCLTSLQTLSLFDVATKRGRGIEELGFLVELGGKLVISGLENVRDKEEAWGARLWEKKKLHVLRYRWDFWREGCGKEEEVLEGLEPHSNLKSLSIEHYKGEYCPSWLVGKIGGDPKASFQPINLVELNLLHCKNVKNLPPLGQYPNLKFLEIQGLKSVRCIGNEFYMNGGDENRPIILFPALEIFTLMNMAEIREWLEVEPTILAFPSLKVLNIIECDNLNNVPRMSRFSSLEELTIGWCSELGWMDDEPFSSHLKSLTIRDCENLRSIPSLDGLSSLLELTVKACRGLPSLPPGLSTCTSLRRLLIEDCGNLESIPEDVGQLHSLEKLTIVKCNELGWISLEPFSSNLKELTVMGCGKLCKMGEGLLTSTCLTDMVISGCDNLRSIPFNGGSQSILRLKIFDCKELREIGGGLSASTRLEELEIESCPSMIAIPSLDGLSSLLEMKLYGCDGLTSLPSGLSTCTSLWRLFIDYCSNLESIPVNVGQLHSLEELCIRRSESLKRLPEESLGCLTRLKKLELGPFSEEVEEFPGLGSIHHLHSSLKELKLIGWDKLCSLPHQLQHLTALEHLEIRDFDGLNALPEWLGNLSSLRVLCFRGCKNLVHLPSKEALLRLSKLHLFRIYGCPQLKENSVEMSKTFIHLFTDSNMAEAFINAAIEVALSKAISILEDPINLAWDFKDQLVKLRSSLALTQAFLQDAERRQLDEPVKVWLEQLSDVASKADDVLDELSYEHLRRKFDTRKRTQVSNFFSPSTNPLAFTLKMANKIKNISQSIKDANRQATELGLQQRVQVSAPVSSGVGGGTHSIVDSSSVIGREADILKVVDLLIGSVAHQSLSIASIVGMAGLGKTTLTMT